jgi:predicted nucleotidyltransferase component of viral defense system
MPLDTIQERLSSYVIQSKDDEVNAVKEICQEIALAGLARADFFKIAAFHGGTALRILYQLRRFSEDLDFVLFAPHERFIWKEFLLGIQTEFEAFGLRCEAQDRSHVEGVVKKAFIKEDSFGSILNLQFKRTRSDVQRIMIKLEIDVDPPSGSTYDSHYLQYPYPFSIVSQDRSSSFASKCHALLCRKYTKGRDWFDFLWYVQRKTPVNLQLLQNALYQTGPFKGITTEISHQWLLEHLRKKIQSIDWDIAKNDVTKFIPVKDQYMLSSWNKEMYTQVVGSMESYIDS